MSYVPTWVYILFFILLYLGIRRCYTRIVTVERIALVPAVFIFLSLRSTVSLFHFSFIGFLLLLMGGIIGALFGHWYVRNCTIRADKQKHLIEIPGSISMLIMVMSIFSIEFFIHYAVDAHWAIAQNDLFKNSAVILSGLIVGISVGRSITYFLKYQQAESVDLIATK